MRTRHARNLLAKGQAPPPGVAAHSVNLPTWRDLVDRWGSGGGLTATAWPTGRTPREPTSKRSDHPHARPSAPPGPNPADPTRTVTPRTNSSRRPVAYFPQVPLIRLLASPSTASDQPATSPTCATALPCSSAAP
jgi:hypothetical protein